MALRIYYDFGSPYAYLAWQRVQLHPERYGPVAWVPVSAAHIFRMDGTAPNMAMPNQARYLMQDVQRWADRLRVPFAPPPVGEPGAMPVRSIEAARLQFLAGAEGKGDAWREAVYLAYFRDGHDISASAVLDALAEEVGLSAGSKAADDPRWKQALIDATARAYAEGAPGVPFAVLERNGLTEHYWGQDRLEWVEKRLSAVA